MNENRFKEIYWIEKKPKSLELFKECLNMKQADICDTVNVVHKCVVDVFRKT